MHHRGTLWMHLIEGVGKTPDMDALYVAEESGRYRSTELTRGPWRSDAQHGGPPSALLTALIEQVVEPDEIVARVSVELLRPIPLVPLDGVVDVTRASRRVRHVHAELHIDGEAAASASGLVLRATEMPEPGWVPDEAAVCPGPEAEIVAPAWQSGTDEPIFHRDALQHRHVSGGFSEIGPAESWVRLAVPVIAGEEPSPLVRVMAATDIGSGISSVYDYTVGFGLINADLTVAVTRPLRGEWVRLQSVSRVSGRGTGLAVTQLGDTDGHVAVATQSLLGVKPA